MSYAVQFTPEQLALKPKFAAMLIEHPENPFVAAQAVFPEDMARALYVSTHWVGDAEVLAEKQRLRDKGADLKTLPAKADLANNIWKRMQSTYDLDAYAKLAKLYADIMAFIEKPQSAVNVNVSQNRVMIVKDKGTDAEWETGVAKQQSALLNASNARH